MPETGVGDLVRFVKMKPTLPKIKPIEGGNLNIGFEMPETGGGNLVLFVKMKPTLPKM
jgi:hypothetical protein